MDRLERVRELEKAHKDGELEYRLEDYEGYYWISWYGSPPVFKDDTDLNRYRRKPCS